MDTLADNKLRPRRWFNEQLCPCIPCHCYPILDFRALWSVTLEVPKQYGFSFWWPYVEYCRRDLVSSSDVRMRILDRALWQYSKENQ